MFSRMQMLAEPILKKIHAHPFNQALAAGTLSKTTFQHYMAQDSLYLADFSKALAIIASRLVDPDHAKQYMQFALDAISAERELHRNYLSMHAKPENEMTAVCFTYTNYVLRMASLASVEEALASVLPCFFVYRDVGKTLFKHHHEAHPYRDWIALYAGDEFHHATERAIAITEALGSQASSAIKERMLTAFMHALKLEWLFWESAYCFEKTNTQGVFHDFFALI